MLNIFYILVNCLAIIVMLKLIIQDKMYGVIGTFFWGIPYNVFIYSVSKYGGSIAPEAVTNYELYQEGHYYLMSHGIYTDVPYEIYHYMDVCEKVGNFSFWICFIWTAIIVVRWKMKKEKEA